MVFIEGVVIRHSKGLYDVQTDGQVVPCRLRGNLKKEFVRHESANIRRIRQAKRKRVSDPVVVGDRVRFERVTEEEGIIVEVFPRRSQFARPVAEGREEHVIMANLDQMVIVFAAAEPRPDLWRLDRFIVVAEASALEALIVLNKMDLMDDPSREHERAEIHQAFHVLERIGYRVLYTSTADGRGLDELRAALVGKISVFCGPSGVGKSSLLNALQPGLNLAVSEVGEVTHLGRHTTVIAQLIPLDCGGWVADTPGIRQLGLWNVAPEDLEVCFREFAPFLGQCRFNDCIHLHEPGCAIRLAVERGEIDERRYRSYAQLRQETPPDR
ncbi:MAG: ribosome small subunit-dependent GTPase A [Abditibacteriales bacterium]|nr:ribosome small subunit-dependent GTPase A [Abditibacteriales bacterium]MDW8364885.1 ribosome small subunit-dependent GTPase A [Abditibacteriales bacterium]